MSRPLPRNRWATADLRIRLVTVLHDLAVLRGDPPGADLEQLQVITCTLSRSQQAEMLAAYEVERAELLRAGQPEVSP